MSASLVPDAATWERANRELLAKIITELTFEEVLAPEPLSDADDSLALQHLGNRHEPLDTSEGNIERAADHPRPVPLPASDDRAEIPEVVASDRPGAPTAPLGSTHGGRRGPSEGNLGRTDDHPRPAPLLVKDDRAEEPEQDATDTPDTVPGSLAASGPYGPNAYGDHGPASGTVRRLGDRPGSGLASDNLEAAATDHPDAGPADQRTESETVRPSSDSPPSANDDAEGTQRWFRLVIGAGVGGEAVLLSFRARRRYLGHWRVDPGSLRWCVAGEEKPLPDVAEFVALAGPVMGVDPSTVAGGLCELANTLVSDAWQLTRGRSSEDLADLDPALVEGEMRGHPWIVANKGRLGFDADDLVRFTPEAQQPLRLLWLAAAVGRADVQTIAGLDHAQVVREQVGDDAWNDLQSRAATAGLDPDAAAYVPVHPWQWRQRIVPHYAAELARRELVPLGEAPPRYLPQQSIRTLADVDRPERRYLKLPVSILNTSVYRGLPRQRAIAAPALTEWFIGLVAADPFLAETGLVLLGEVASVSVAHRAFEAVPGVPYQHTEMLGAIWRESVVGHLRPGERAVTLAALLHRDPAGVPFLAPVIAHSGLDVATWVDRLHEATLPPLVHVLYRYGATFSPHAQNCLLVLRDQAPVRLAVKDFVDDAMVSSDPLPELASLPPAVRRALGDGLEAEVLVQWIQGGLLVCVHRYLSELLAEHFGYPEAAFWASARRSLRTYQERFADELAERFDLFDLDAPAFVKLCLNRVRLLERGYADDAERPTASAVGWIDNPLALDELDARTTAVAGDGGVRL